MQIRCPHCHQPIELVDDELSSEMTCACCGSDFNLALDGDTVTEADTHSKTIAHFTLIDWLGQGTFGSVWKALDTKLDREVAVKIPRKDRLSTTEAEQFLREARAAAQLRHPNIVPVHEVGREDGTLYIVSDLIEGLTLADWLTGPENPFFARAFPPNLLRLARSLAPRTAPRGRAGCREHVDRIFDRRWS